MIIYNGEAIVENIFIGRWLWQNTCKLALSGRAIFRFHPFNAGLIMRIENDTAFGVHHALVDMKRLRVGNYRIIFEETWEEMLVYEIRLRRKEI